MSWVAGSGGGDVKVRGSVLLGKEGVAEQWGDEVSERDDPTKLYRGFGWDK